ncbi:protein neprosin-like [Gastrolobium bilobum]|uniref:protein neprosin-like n=1 Tax=Gastrolobium bilobum TaxID=150636 RepID=UPI002AAFB0B9|nr:protein neprosin-like [Gastrolobium bilobum]
MAILLFLSLCLVTNTYRVGATLPISRTEELEERHRKLIHKPPIRSIQTEFGYTIDCVDINKQPAFDHPLLKNHKLQRKPTFLQRRSRTSEHVLPTRTSVFELEKDSCPIGYVPIRRTTKDELIRMKSLSDYTYYSLVQGAPGTHFAALYTKKRNNNSYVGVNAHINVHNPRVKKHQMSCAQIAVQNGEHDGINTILFGWQSDAFKKTGCYNMLCPGFVQIDRNVFLGIGVRNISDYGGQQFELPLSILQDSNSKNWWLIVNDINVGYFPAALFSNMSVADLVGWGGRVTGVVKGTSPQMGSGYFPDGDLTHACFARRISYNVPESLQEPQKNPLEIYVDKPHCYNLTYFGFFDDNNRYTFQFGGPGGDCGM